MTGPETTGGLRRGVFDVDVEHALDALRLEWGESYVVCFDDAVGDGRRWQAWRLGKPGRQLTGSTPDELSAAIGADLADETQ
jgi:hypothetical protein